MNWEEFRRLAREQGLRCPSCGSTELVVRGRSEVLYEAPVRPHGEEGDIYSIEEVERTVDEVLCGRCGLILRTFDD
ncbi:MAG: hypothetical protein QXP81_06305 [Nitrososphaerota archaeon]